MGGVYTLLSFIHWNLLCGFVRNSKILFQNYAITTNTFSIIFSFTRKRYPCVQNWCASATVTPYWLADAAMTNHRPSYLICLSFLFPDVCDGVCNNNGTPCFQSCPPDSEGNMKFACKAKKWHKVTETCHTLNTHSIFEVMSFLLYHGLSHELSE